MSLSNWFRDIFGNDADAVKTPPLEAMARLLEEEYRIHNKKRSGLVERDADTEWVLTLRPKLKITTVAVTKPENQYASGQAVITTAPAGGGGGNPSVGSGLLGGGQDQDE